MDAIDNSESELTVEEIRARWASATPGPWSANVQRETYGTAGVYHYIHGAEGPSGEQVLTTTQSYDLAVIEGSEADLRAVGNAPTDIAWLLKRIEELEAEVAWCGQRINGGPP